MKPSPTSPLTVLLGWDPRETLAYDVAAHSLMRHSSMPVLHFPLILEQLRDAGLYRRPTSTRDGKLWDDISGAAMSTEFAISRFFAPFYAQRDGQRRDSGWLLFCDADVLFRDDVASLMDHADPRYAVQVVQHEQHVRPGELKMDGQAQLPYPRKNWSSVMLWNLAHPAHQRLTTATLNSLPGRDLHALCWLQDAEVGHLPRRWNWLEGHSLPCDPGLVHFTRGGPWLPGDWRDTQYADEWLAELGRFHVREALATGEF